MWEHRCDESLKKSGFVNVGARRLAVLLCPQGAWARVLACTSMLLNVHGPSTSMEKGWKLIATDLELDPPRPLNLYLGCAHERKELKTGSTSAQVMTYTMAGFLKS